MATSKQKAFCVLQFVKTESAITVQRAFHIKFGRQLPNDNNILRYTAGQLLRTDHKLLCSITLSET
ncbi:UNVERIFIED_CONTAM: hypothetical protein NCL1_12882 [Trichonephila clavipes]